MYTKQYATKYPRDHWRNQRRNQKIPRNKWQWKHATQNLWDAEKEVLRRKPIANTILPQETRKISNKQPKLTPKATRERRTKKNPKLAEGKKS